MTFYAHIVLPNGRTLYEETRPQIAAAYKTGRVPELLPGVSGLRGSDGTSVRDTPRPQIEGGTDR